jgi:hypothetical protein
MRTGGVREKIFPAPWNNIAIRVKMGGCRYGSVKKNDFPKTSRMSQAAFTSPNP